MAVASVKEATYEVVVVVVVPSLCQPSGDATVFWGSTKFSKPSTSVSLVIGRTRYCVRREVSTHIASTTPPTDRDLRDEVGQLNDIARMGIDEGLEPRASLVVLNLHDVRKGEGAVLLGDELDGRWVLVELARERTLRLRDGIINGERRDSRGDGC